MEYVLYNVIMNEVWQIDMINEDTEEGVFDDLMDDPFFEGIEDEEYTTIERIPEPEWSIALAGIREDAKDEAADRFGNGYTDSDLDVVAEELLTEHENLRQYEEICFWDTDFAFLDDCDEDTLIRSQAGEFMGLGERQDVKKMEMEIGGNTVKMEVNIAPWEMENWVAEG